MTRARFHQLVRIAGALALLILFLVGLLWRPAEPVGDDVYSICGSCGLSVEEIDQLIEHNRSGLMTREESVRLWEKTYDGQDDSAELMQLCRPCVDAIADVAFKNR